ncbi:MAG: hypothetical protein ACK5BQ_01350 [Ignavibacteria bacterium]|jgi:hypothetical protein
MSTDLRAGIHLILVPTKGKVLSDVLEEPLQRIMEHTIVGRNGFYHASSLQHDHLHILMSVAGIEGLHRLIDSLVVDLQQVIAQSEPALANFAWEQGVHVTLLPPWHVEIMASFVRDQHRYHESHTLEQELDEVFRPNSVTLDEELDEESALCVN